MKYAEAKEALEKSGVTVENAKGFYLMHDHPFNQSYYEVDIILITDIYWGYVWNYMNDNDCSNARCITGLRFNRQRRFRCVFIF